MFFLHHRSVPFTFISSIINRYVTLGSGYGRSHPTRNVGLSRSCSTISRFSLASYASMPQCDACAFAKRKCDGDIICCSLCRKRGNPCIYSQVRERLSGWLFVACTPLCCGKHGLGVRCFSFQRFRACLVLHCCLLLLLTTAAAASADVAVCEKSDEMKQTNAFNLQQAAV